MKTLQSLLSEVVTRPHATEGRPTPQAKVGVNARRGQRDEFKAFLSPVLNEDVAAIVVTAIAGTERHTSG